MTVNEALNVAGEQINGNASRELLLQWLYEIENTVCSEVGQTHHGKTPDMTPIDTNTDMERELFIPDPDSSVYILYMIMKNDLYMRDTQQYLNSAAVFANAYSSFADKYNRENMPDGVNKIKL